MFVLTTNILASRSTDFITYTILQRLATKKCESMDYNNVGTADVGEIFFFFFQNCGKDFYQWETRKNANLRRDPKRALDVSKNW